MGGGIAEREVWNWRQSLARRQESETPVPEFETSPKKVWAVQDLPNHLSGSLSIGSPPIMDDT